MSKQPFDDCGHRIVPVWAVDVAQCDGVEVHPCRVVATDTQGRQDVETCEPHQAHFWSAYLRYSHGRAECVGDFPRRAMALRLAQRLCRLYPHLTNQ